MGYSIQDIVSWYQKKIGTYDKQQWEKTVEQRILSGFTHVPMKTAKLKTDFIDVDLVRGSAFTKAKPKHGLLKVTKLATLRLLLLPFYYNWWINQTSLRMFTLLSTLYGLQAVSTSLFIYIWLTNDPNNILENIPASEVLAPIAMMLVLSITHSHIVSTHSVNSKKFDVQNKSNTSSRRLKRTKRRSVLPPRSRPSHTYSSDSKLVSDISFENSNTLNDNKFSKRNKNKSMLEKSSRTRNHRNVMWDTSQVQMKSRSRVYEHEDSCITSLENSCLMHHQVPKLRVCVKEVEQIAGVDRMHVPEREESPPETPSLDDDGFESLDGSGSTSDSTREEQDISLTAAEYENAKSRGAVNSINDDNINLVINSPSCPSFKSNDTKLIPNQSNGRIYNNSNGANHKNITVTAEEYSAASLIQSEDVPLSINTASEIQNLDAICTCSLSPNRTNRTEDSNISKLQLNSNTKPGIVKNQLKSDSNDKDDTDTDVSETDTVSERSRSNTLLSRRNGPHPKLSISVKSLAESSINSSGDESEEDETLSSPECSNFCPLLTEGTTSAGEWIGVTTNSEECSYSSEIDGSDNQYEQITLTSDANEHPYDWELEMMPNVILSPSNTASGKVSCTMWEKREVKKANLSVLDISSAIIARVEAMPESVDYFYIGLVMSMMLSSVPSGCRLMGSLYDNTGNTKSELVSTDGSSSNRCSLPYDVHCPASTVDPPLTLLNYILFLIHITLGTTFQGNMLIMIALLERFCLASIFFFLLTVAERTFKQRFLYAKFFSHLTSFRRARKSELPHFRLNKVRNIKTWLSVRSYLKKRGPQRSVDVIVSSAFLITVILLSFLSVELLKDSEYNIEMLGWCIVIGIFMLRFMTLGTKINRKYRSLSTIITEQINLYLQIEQKPNKKEELMVANSVLKLAADLLKELESPFKISGFSANPYLYTVTKVVMLSALSGILSEILGFKLKLHKIKIK